MSFLDRNPRINEIVVAHFGAPQAKKFKRIIATGSTVFDTRRRNVHESKAMFLKELSFVELVVSNLSSIVDNALENSTQTDPNLVELFDENEGAIDRIGRQLFSYKPAENNSELIVNSMAAAGFGRNSMIALLATRKVYVQRLKLLKEQEELFWSLNHRPPNYYARTIALRFAKCLRAGWGIQPTFGTSSEGSHASTAYGRALEDLFAELELDASVKAAAEWAMSQIPDDEPAPSENNTDRVSRYSETLRLMKRYRELEKKDPYI